MNVADLEVGKPDAANVVVKKIFARRQWLYAVYATENRVEVHYSDYPEREAEQRLTIAKLNPLRSDINSLIDGWRRHANLIGTSPPGETPSGANPRLAAKSFRYDRATADGLILALEDQFDNAQTQLQNTKADILNERTSWARLQYLVAAAGSCLLVIAICSVLGIKWIWDNFLGFKDHYAAMLLLAGGTGAVGAFFSIAIFIRRRTVLTDLRSRDNFVDAALRVLIGAIAGAVFVGFLHTDAVSVKLGDTALQVDPDHWVMAMLAAFLAGFSEQLIPDLLAKTAAGVATGQAGASANGNPPPATNNGNPPPANGGAGPANPPPGGKADPADPDLHADGCEGVQVTEAEATADADLPPASGGVAAEKK